jgi:septal ring factor EnvC (AmiA/AmiB activator)
VKILAKFFLSCFFLFFAGVSGRAQDCKDSFFSLNNSAESAINDLQKELSCLNEKIGGLDYYRIYNMESDLDTAAKKIQTLTLDLETANTKIETLESRLTRAEDETQALRGELAIYSSLSSARTSRKASETAHGPWEKYQAAPQTAPHPESAKPASSNPKAPASKQAPINKPKPTAKTIQPEVD